MRNPKSGSRLLVLMATSLALLGGSWMLLTGAAEAGTTEDWRGRPWMELSDTLGAPVCRALSARITSRESAARRPEGRSSLLIPHAELVLAEPGPVHGLTAGASNRILIFTRDPEIDEFLQRHIHGDLANYAGETRVAIDRAAPVRVVEIGPAGRVLGIQEIRPVFLSVTRR
ncbi:MAG: hypothetical protein CMJ51_00865 [Planctomycetaceae bacterium]|nr:hypothetical protein [Planctomycetaceae bacterium]